MTRLTLEGGALAALALAEEEDFDLLARLEFCLAGFALQADLLVDAVADFLRLPFAGEADLPGGSALIRRRLEGGGEGVR